LPTTIRIDYLLKSEEGMAVARDSYSWSDGKSKISQNTGPIDVTITPQGYVYVLKGYHRIIDAIKAGEASMAVKYHNWNDKFAERLDSDNDRFNGTARQLFDPLVDEDWNDSAMPRKKMVAAVRQTTQQ
jgi:hypothetical protein